MKNSDKFLSMYNKLDDHLRGMDQSDHRVSFTSTVVRLSKTERVIKNFKNKLIEYNDLRNAIVHERIDGRVIAEPNDFAISDFEKIYNRIVDPKSIYDICHQPVKTLDEKTKLKDALVLMQKYDYSQIPVYNKGEFVNMLNSETITSWMRSNINNDTISIHETTVEEIMTFKSAYKKTILKPRNTSIYEIMDLYKKNVYEPVQIDAIIITEHGKTTEKPLTIITDFDIPLILSNF